MTSNLSSNIADFRISYEQGELLESNAAVNPIDQFQTWLNLAIEKNIAEPTAMTLCTVENNRPSSRVVLLKGFDNGGFKWFTNYQSRKGQALSANPFAALQFHWVALERQVRIEGKVEKVSADESDAYYRSRPLGSRLGAWASPQSAVVQSRAELEQREAQFKAQFGENPPRPAHWGGYVLKPDYVEFWQGRRNRLHDRLAYRLGEGGWVIERLAP